MLDQTRQTHNRAKQALLCLACLATLTACENKQNDNAPPTTNPTTTTPAPVASASASGKTETPEPKASASAEATSETPKSLVGTWEGTYEAKKGSVEMPPKVKDKVRDKDDGKAAAGKGTITLTISKDGELKGKTEGALGTATLTGKTEANEIRASLFPDDATAKQAMFGIVTAKLEDNHIKGIIRVANGDASIVREAPINLEQKK